MNILVVDDHSFLKEGIEIRIKQIFKDANVVFTTKIGTALFLLRDSKPDLVISDLEFDHESDYSGFDFIKEVKKVKPNTKTIALTNYNSYRIMKKARQSGFNSFLLKTCSFDEFANTLKNVLQSDDEYISSSMKKLLKKRHQLTESIFSDSLYGIAELSEHELEALILSSESTERTELANTMCKSPFTIDAYFKSILKKLKLKSRQEAQLFAKEFMKEILKRKQ